MKPPSKSSIDRFWARKAREVARMLDGATYAPPPFDYVRCADKARKGCKEKLARVMTVDGRIQFEILARVTEVNGAIALDGPSGIGHGQGVLVPGEREVLRCAVCGGSTTIDVAMLEKAVADKQVQR